LATLDCVNTSPKLPERPFTWAEARALGISRYQVAVEYDGCDFHSTPAQRAADEARRKWLREQGWIVIVVGKSSFRPQARGSWLQELCEALGLN